MYACVCFCTHTITPSSVLVYFKEDTLLHDCISIPIELLCCRAEEKNWIGRTRKISAVYWKQIRWIKCVCECVCIYLIDGYLRWAGMNTLIMQNSLTWTSKNLKQAHISMGKYSRTIKKRREKRWWKFCHPHTFTFPTRAYFFCTSIQPEVPEQGFIITFLTFGLSKLNFDMFKVNFAFSTFKA